MGVAYRELAKQPDRTEKAKEIGYFRLITIAVHGPYRTRLPVSAGPLDGVAIASSRRIEGLIMPSGPVVYLEVSSGRAG